MGEFDVYGSSFLDSLSGKGGGSAASLLDDYDDGSLYGAYVSSGFQEHGGKQFQGMNAFDPDDQFVRGIGHASDPFALDPDPYGTATMKYGVSVDRPADFGRDTVAELNIFGKTMSAETMGRYDSGRRLMEIAKDVRTGHKRGFLDAITDFSWSDVPFLGMLASVQGSYRDAVEVSETFKKLQNGDKVSDEEALKARLYMAENEYRAHGSWGSTVGDIVRAAPGFMVEFLASGKVLSGLRSATVKAAGKSESALATLAVNRGTKRLASELAEREAVRVVEGKLGETVVGSALRKGVRELTQEDLSGISSRLSTTLKPYVSETMTKFGFGDDMVSKVTDNLVKRNLAAAVAKKGSSNAFTEFMRGTANAVKDAASRGLLDHGTWGTESASQLFFKHNSAGKALADALGAFTIEAPLRGGIMYGMNKLVGLPVSAIAGGTVSESQLSLQESALRQNNEKLMADAESISMGMDMMEYVSENAGRGFGSLIRAAGLATGISKQAGRRLVGEAGGLLAEAKDLEAGGFLRSLVRKAIGTPAEYAAKNRTAQVDAVLQALGGNVTRAEASQIAGGVVPATLSEEAKATIGGDVAKFVSDSLKRSMGVEENKLLSKAYLRYTLSDLMVRKGWGPDTVMDIFDKMGYDGVLGEMFEERYNDFAKGLFGLDDKADHSFKERLKNAVGGLYPGFDQLLAEAVGFSVPMVTRASVLAVQRKLGGASQVQRARTAGANFQTASGAQRVVETTLGSYWDRTSKEIERLGQEKAGVETRLKEENKAIEDAGITSQEEIAARTGSLKEQIAQFDQRIQAQEDARRRTLEVNGIKEFSEENASRIMLFSPTASTESADDTKTKLSTAKSSDQLAEAMGAQDAFLEDVAYLGEALYDASAKDDGTELPLWRRIASKAVGVAGAVICGEPALAAANVTEWASVDEGLDPVVAYGLKGLFKTHRDAALARIEKRNSDTAKKGGYEITEQEIRDEMREQYTKAAKDFARARLAIAGVRMFSQNEMLDQAAVYCARQDGMQFDVGTRSFVTPGKAGSVSLNEYVDANRDRVESLRGQIAEQTLRILSDGSLSSADTAGHALSLVKLPVGASNEEKVATRLALEMSGFGSVITSVQLEDGRTVESQLGEASTVLDGPVITRIAGAESSEKVDANDIAQVARAMRFPLNTGTDEDIARVRKEIYDVCRQLAVAVDPVNTLGFVKAIDGDSRLYDSPTDSVIATRRADGRWYVTADVTEGKRSENGDRVTTSFATEEELLAQMKEWGYGKPVERKAEFVQANVLRTTDPLLLAKKIGVAETILRRTRVRRGQTWDYSSVPPAWRRKPNGSYEFSDVRKPGESRSEAQRKMDDELRDANAFVASDYGNDLSYFDRLGAKTEAERRAVRDRCKRAYDSAYDQNHGYMRVIDQVLSDAGCTVPSSEQLSVSLLSGGMPEYTTTLRSFTAHAQSLTTYVPVNFLQAQDYSTAIMNAALVDAYARYRRLIDSKGKYNSTLRNFVHAVDSIAERRIWNADTSDEDRGNLESLRRDITSAYNHPSPRAFQELAAAFALFRAETAKEKGVNQTKHSAAMAAIAEEVRNTPEFVDFVGLVDLMLGGDGFAFEATRANLGSSKTQPVASRGIARLMAAFDDGNSTALADALAKFHPFGLTPAEFVTKVNDHARAMGLPQTGVVSAGTATSVPGVYSALRSAFENAGLKSQEDVSKMIEELGTAYAKRPDGGSDRGRRGTVRRRVSEFNDFVTGLKSQISARETEVADLKKKLDEANANKDLQNAAKAQARRDLETAQENLRKAEALLEKLSAADAEFKAKLTRAGVLAGDSIASNWYDVDLPDEQGNQAPRPAQEDSPTGDDGLDNLGDLMAAIPAYDPEGANEFTPTYLNPLPSGELQIVEASAEPSDLTKDDVPYGTNIVRNLLRVTGRSEESRDDFMSACKELFPSINEGDVELLWQMCQSEASRRNAEAKNRGDVKEESDAQDGEEEGTHSANTAYGEKDAAAYDNKPLNCFLAFCNLASPETGRNLQAFFVSLRNNVKRVIASNPAKGSALEAAAKVLDDLLNPRAVVNDDVKTANDREAVFSARVRDLLEGRDGITLDGIIQALMEKDANGDTVSRKGAFFLSYLRSLTPSARRNMLQLVCNSASCSSAAVVRRTVSAGNGKNKSVLAFSPRVGGFRSVSESALTSSFLKFVGLSKDALAKRIEELRGAIRAELPNFKDATDISTVAGAIKAARANFDLMVKVLTPFFGAESPLLQAASSREMFDFLKYSYQYSSDSGSDFVTFAKQSSLADPKYARDRDRTPEMLQTILDILDAYAADSKPLGDREAMSRIVVAAMECGIGSGATDGLISPTKSSDADTGWMRVLTTYSASLPETVVRAETLPERSGKAGASVAIASRGIVPVISQWMDRALFTEDDKGVRTYDKGSFAYLAKNCLAGPTGDALRKMSDEDFLEKVMPECRQSMTWPDFFHTPILAKNISRDYSPREVIDSCKWTFENELAPWGKLKDGSEGLKSAKTGRWHVPVYSGDHSGGVLLQMPRLTGLDWLAVATDRSLGEKFVGYEAAADAMCDAIGLKKLGNDTKRSALSSNEAPGLSMRGARVDGGKVTYGECRLCIFKNFDEEMQGKGGDESFIGTIPGVGYGLEQQKACAKDPESQTLKLHFLSSSGGDLTMLKGLTTALTEDSAKTHGAFAKGSATEAVANHILNIHKGLKNSDLSTVLALDFDAVKVGVGNSKIMGRAKRLADGSLELGKDGNVKTQPLLKYVFDRIKARGVKAYQGDALDEILADGEDGKFSWYNSVTGEETRVTIGDLLGVEGGYDGNEADNGIRVDVVKGLHGDNAISISYVDNSLMSYTVANVSHEAVPEVGRTPKNNMIDALTMAAVQLRGRLTGDTEADVMKVLETVSNWGLMASVLNTDPVNVAAVGAESNAIRDIVNRGEAPGGQNYEEQLARDAFKRLTKALNVPMNKIDAALVTCGAIYDDELGKVVDNTDNETLRAFHKGSRVFSLEDSRWYGTSRSLGLAQINVRDDGFRYGMFVNLERLDNMLKSEDSPFADIATSAGDGKDAVEVLEQAFARVRDADLDHAGKLRAAFDLKGKEGFDEAYKAYVAAQKRARSLREALLGCFDDHHGNSVADRMQSYNGNSKNKWVWGVGLDDLFIAAKDRSDTYRAYDRDGRQFDRSAFLFDVPNHEGVKSLFLAGSTFGLPRTPSYNGSMWLQTVRASIPATEVDNGDHTFSCGRDAMVMPDPQSLKILGCDHDGDKAQCYMYRTDPFTGVASTVEIPAPTSELLGNPFAKSGSERRKYLDELVAAGIVRREGLKGQVDRGYRLPKFVTEGVSNAFVRGLMDMSRNLAVVNGNEETDFYRTAMANATKARPIEDEDLWDRLKKAGDSAKQFMKGHTLGEAFPAADVATSSHSADKARGMVVSLASVLHLAQFSGKFGQNSKIGRMFNWDASEYQKWVDFMYRFDGISNATFDDIKEQICGRLGWTSGMMDTLLIDIVFSGERAPTTDREFFDCILEYVESVAKRGSRYYMMVASDPADNGPAERLVHEKIRATFVPDGKGGYRDSIYRDDVCKVFGISDDGKKLRRTKDRSGVGKPATEFVDMLVALSESDKDGAKYGVADEDRESYVLRRLVADVAQHKGDSAGAGFAYWAISGIADGSVSTEEAADQYLRWSHGRNVLSVARTFSESINFKGADPGSGSKMGRRESLAQAYSETMKKGAEDKLVDGTLDKMSTATLCSYNVPGVRTRQGRMSVAAATRDAALVQLAREVGRRASASPALRDTFVKLCGLQGQAPTKLLNLEGNLQTVPYFLAAMQTMPQCDGTDVMSADGGEKAWDTLRIIADATARNSLQGPSGAVTGNTMTLRRGIEAMYNVMYALVASSHAAKVNPAFAFIASREEHKFEKKNKSNGVPAYAFGGVGLRRLVATFRNKDSESTERAQSYVKRVCDGELDPGGTLGVRSPVFSTPQFAKDFTLSTANLNDLSVEGTKLDAESGLRKDIEICKEILAGLDKTNGQAIAITPSMMFRQFIPVYTTFTSRTLGAPKPGDSSLVSLIPGLYERLSRKQAEYDSGVLDFGDRLATGQSLMDIVCSSNLYPVNLMTTQLLAEKGQHPAELMEKLDPSVADTVVSLLSQIDPSKLEDDGLSGTMEGRRALEAILGGVDRQFRSNPDGRHMIDVLGCGGLFRSLHRYANECTGNFHDNQAPDPEGRRSVLTEELTVAPAGEVNEDIVNLVAVMQSALGSWADVRYEGGDSFTISSRGGLQGLGAYRFSGGKGVNAVITVHVGKPAAGKGMKLDVNSPAVAQSFCESAKFLGISADQFMTLMKDEREALVKRYTLGATADGINDFALSTPEWSLDGKGIATLVGAINIGNAKETGRAFHEYFHSMIGMFRMMDIFSEDDIATLRDRFGKAANGSSALFNEEAAAEEFRKYVMTQVRGRAYRDDGDGKRRKLQRYATDKVTGIFETILDILKAFFDAIRDGFSYTASKDDKTLFNLVLSGRTTLSASKLKSVVGQRQYDAYMTLAPAMTYDAKAAWLEQNLKVADGMRRELDRMLPTAPEGTVEDAKARAAERLGTSPERKNPMERSDKDMTPRERNLRALLLNELNRIDPDSGDDLPPRKTAIKELVDQLSAIRAGSEAGVTPETLGSVMYGIPAEDPEVPSTVLPEDVLHEKVKEATASDPFVTTHGVNTRIGEALVHEALGMLSDEDRAILSRVNTKANWIEKLLASKHCTDIVKKVVDRRKLTITRGLKDAEGVLGFKFGKDSSAYNTICRLYAYLQSHANGTMPRSDRAVKLSADESVLSKSDPSTADITGFLMASGGYRPADVVNALRKRLSDLYRDGTHTGAVIETLLDRLSGFDFDETSVLSGDLDSWLDENLPATFLGIVRKWDDRINDYGDYVASNNDSEEAAANRELYGIGDDAASDPVRRMELALVQKVLRDFADTLYGVKAAVKFYREIGFQPGTWHDTAFTGRNVPPVEFAELADRFGIGEDHLKGDPDILDFNDQPQFVMANMDDWLAASVRESFGNEQLREMFMRESREFRTLLATLNNVENWNACYFGVNRLEGQNLLKLVTGTRTHEMRDGFFHSVEDGKATLGFDIASGVRGQVTDIAFTEDEYRMVDLFLKSLAVRANGGSKYVTGIDNIRFNWNMSADENDYSMDKVEERIRRFSAEGTEEREIPSAVMALHRMQKQWFGSVLSKGDDGKGMGAYRRFVDSMCRALDHANEIDESHVQDTREHISGDWYNAIVLEDMEKDGVVICERSDEKLKDGDGYRMPTSAVMVLDCAEVERAFKDSSAYAKLKAAGRSDDMLDGTKTIERYMKPYRKMVAEIRKHPWLTAGDGRFFNNYGTPMPFFNGSGGCMYHTNRAVRESQKIGEVRLGKYEETFRDMISSKVNRMKYLDELSLPQLSLLHDYFGTKETGAELRQALIDGKYARGTKASLDTGLQVQPDDGFVQVSKVIYAKLLETRLAAAEGRPAQFDNDQALERMIADYERASEEGGGSIVGSMGMTDEQMFRLHGALPANMQLGHKIHATLHGIANALQFRSTLVNMLMTKGSDGKPVCYMKPAVDAVEKGGLTDSIWGVVAKWWAECNPGLKYDVSKSGVENAAEMYDKLHELRASSDGRKTLNGKKFSELSSDEIDSASIAAVMACEDDPEDTNKSELNRLAGNRLRTFDGGEAIGYAKHLFQSSRVLGASARTKWMNRIMGWSKSMSVAYSFFFPIATKWESATAAVGAIATIGSNVSGDLARRNAGALRKLQDLFSLGNGWMTGDFVGFKDIIRMMDTDDPFLGDLMVWAESLGISMSTSLQNPMEPSKGMVASDIRKFVDRVRAATGSSEFASRLDGILSSMLLRSGEKAFNYALNATKLAVTCQVAMKLKAEAERKHKAFDPIRDLRKYAGYIDSEIGGVNPLRYAWAHPEMQAAMNGLFFSWQWTRTAWEAGGGTLFEDVLFGGHSFTKETRNYMIGRWIRMFGAIMIGVPMMAQIIIKALALAMGRDDDDDKWFTWQNEDKAFWTAFDITPLLKAIGDTKDCAGRGRNGYDDLTWFGKAANAVASVARKVPVAGRLAPGYTGEDEANKTTRNRRYYMHFGKQGWEFFRWFTDPGQQFFSKLSMPTQRLLEGMIGRNLSYLDRELPWENMGAVERWLAPNGAGVNMVKAFLPFTVNGMATFGDAGALSMFGPVQMGTSQSSVIERMASALSRWADNDREGYRFGTRKRGKNKQNLTPVLADLVEEARRNGHDPDEMMQRAVAKLTSKYYGRLFEALPQTPDGDFDVREVERCARAINRLGRKYADVMSALKKRVKKAEGDWRSLPEEYRGTLKNTTRNAIRDPFGTYRTGDAERIDY